MILGRDLFTALGLYLQFSENVIMGSDGTYEGWSTPMIDVSNYYFKPLIEKIVKLKESFINAYVNNFLESEGTMSSTRKMSILLDAKYQKVDLNKVMAEQCHHLSSQEWEILLHLLKTLKIFLWDAGYVGNGSGRFGIKIWSNTSMFAALSSAEATQGNVQKGIRTNIKIGSD